MNLPITRNGDAFSADVTPLLSDFVGEFLQFEGLGGMELLSLTIDGSGMELDTPDQDLVSLLNCPFLHSLNSPPTSHSDFLPSPFPLHLGILIFFCAAVGSL